VQGAGTGAIIDGSKKTTIYCINTKGCFIQMKQPFCVD
jgi:hypothetical protein